jgi:putative peptidoglycan lipid II flippase
MRWLAISFDWIGMHNQPVSRMVLLGACLVLFAALYFGMLWLMGFKYAYFKRRVK